MCSEAISSAHHSPHMSSESKRSGRLRGESADLMSEAISMQSACNQHAIT